MQKLFSFFFFTLCIACFLPKAEAQLDGSKPSAYRVAIFAPLYLDSVFADGSYKYGRTFPKFALQGLDFVQGAQIALDSIPIPNSTIYTQVYDSKSYTQGVPALIASKALDKVDLIIGAVKDQEYGQLASFASTKNIPFISAVLPNDGGVTQNPFLVIINPTLKAHCEAIYSYILSNHSADNIILASRPGSQENVVQQNFKDINTPDGKPLLKITQLNFPSSDFSALAAKMDSTKNNVIIGGSLTESFANDLATYLQAVSKTYKKVMLIGMPNWDGFSNMQKNKTLADFPVYYTSPFYNAKTDEHSKKIRDIYLSKYKGVPSDLTYKGYEITLQGIKVLARYPNDMTSHLNDYPYRIFSDFRFRPVFLNNRKGLPDYFENKNLYLMRIMNGSITRAW